MESSRSDHSCRLCGGHTVEQFRMTVLAKYDVGCLRCDRCESLQTEPPFWLDEAYSDQRRFFDVGAAARNQRLQALVWYLVRIFGMAGQASALDWGGSDGLFTRMMRDIGIDAYHSDKYATNTYAAGFDDVPDREYRIVTAMEVWEHLSDPGDSIAAIFARKPDIHILTTELYVGQRAEWSYLYPTTGRHIFFYSRAALAWIAEKYGYSFASVGRHTVFFKSQLSPLRRLLLRLLLSGRGEKWVRAGFELQRSSRYLKADRRRISALVGESGSIGAGGDYLSAR